MSWWNVRYVELQENRAMVTLLSTPPTPSWWSRNFTIFIWNVSYSVRPQRITNSNRTRTKLPKFRFLTLITPHCLCFLCYRSDRKTTIKIWKRRNILRIDIEMTKSQNLISSWDWLTFCLHFMKCLHLVEFQLGTCPGCPWLDKKQSCFFLTLACPFLFFSFLFSSLGYPTEHWIKHHGKTFSSWFDQLFSAVSREIHRWRAGNEQDTFTLPILCLACLYYLFIYFYTSFQLIYENMLRSQLSQSRLDKLLSEMSLETLMRLQGYNSSNPNQKNLTGRTKFIGVELSVKSLVTKEWYKYRGDVLATGFVANWK